MPTVARLESGAVVKVKGREHLPHHVHVEWKEEEVLLKIANGDIYMGEVPSHVLVEARAYVAANREALTERFFALNPTLPPPRPETNS
jgi:hypothetical protein